MSSKRNRKKQKLKTNCDNQYLDDIYLDKYNAKILKERRSQNSITLYSPGFTVMFVVIDAYVTLPPSPIFSQILSSTKQTESILGEVERRLNETNRRLGADWLAGYTPRGKSDSCTEGRRQLLTENRFGRWRAGVEVEPRIAVEFLSFTMETHRNNPWERKSHLDETNKRPGAESLAVWLVAHTPCNKKSVI